MHTMSQLCERARAWSSLRADGELSELESALLDAHLGRCAGCRSFAVSTETVAAALRSAHLDEPAPPVLIPTRERAPRAIRALRITVAALVVAAVGLLGSASRPATGAKTAKPVVMVAGLESPDRLRELRRPSLVEKGHSLPRNRFVPGVAV
jgi:predicted anti-sigma-YlaC factor YlaD